MTSRLKNDCANPPRGSSLLKFSEIVEVAKFGSYNLSGFRVAVNILVVWDKNPLSEIH